LRRTRKTRRDALALALSTVFHVVILAFVAEEVVKPYQLPQFAPAPMDVRIVTAPIPPPPLPRLVVRPTVKPQPAPPPKPAPPKPAPPKPQQAQQQPQPPKPQTPTPPTPAKPEPPKPAPPKPSPLATPVAPAQRPAPTPRPAPAPTRAVTQAPPTPTPGPPKPAPPSPTNAPSPLNIHRPAQPAPLSVPSLPFAPAAGPAGRPGAASGGPPASSAAPGGATNANGARAFPYGVMPSGGPGLRGTLVGCANAQAVGLTREERNRCNERFGVGVTKTPVLDPISPAKRRAFDDAAAKQDIDRRERESTAFGARALSGGGPEPKPAWTPGTPP
jgi:hypothetical protein